MMSGDEDGMEDDVNELLLAALLTKGTNYRKKNVEYSKPFQQAGNLISINTYQESTKESTENEKGADLGEDFVDGSSTPVQDETSLGLNDGLDEKTEQNGSNDITDSILYDDFLIDTDFDKTETLLEFDKKDVVSAEDSVATPEKSLHVDITPLEREISSASTGPLKTPASETTPGNLDYNDLLNFDFEDMNDLDSFLEKHTKEEPKKSAIPPEKIEQKSEPEAKSKTVVEEKPKKIEAATLPVVNVKNKEPEPPKVPPPKIIYSKEDVSVPKKPQQEKRNPVQEERKPAAKSSLSFRDKGNAKALDDLDRDLDSFLGRGQVKTEQKPQRKRRARSRSPEAPPPIEPPRKRKRSPKEKKRKSKKTHKRPKYESSSESEVFSSEYESEFSYSSSTDSEYEKERRKRKLKKKQKLKKKEKKLKEKKSKKQKKVKAESESDTDLALSTEPGVFRELTTVPVSSSANEHGRSDGETYSSSEDVRSLDQNPTSLQSPVEEDDEDFPDFNEDDVSDDLLGIASVQPIGKGTVKPMSAVERLKAKHARKKVVYSDDDVSLQDHDTLPRVGKPKKSLRNKALAGSLKRKVTLEKPSSRSVENSDSESSGAGAGAGNSVLSSKFIRRRLQLPDRPTSATAASERLTANDQPRGSVHSRLGHARTTGNMLSRIL